jgi:formamidopyrimidine-DNA glycosylase
VLTESIAARGTSFRDYRDASGARGGFVEHLAVYGRAGEAVSRCAARLIGTHAIDGRMTVPMRAPPKLELLRRRRRTRRSV